MLLLLTGMTPPPKRQHEAVTWQCSSYVLGVHRYEECQSSDGRYRTCDSYTIGSDEVTECEER
jgi:hypothetical protein